MSYDEWKTTDTTDEGFATEEVEGVCDCGQPLDGGEAGLCVDCVREARDFAADCSDAEFALVFPFPLPPPLGRWPEFAKGWT